MTTARGFAPAKINLTLHVTGQRADGYHLLDSLVVFANVGDLVSARAAPGLSLLTSGPFGDQVPQDGSNLVTRAADMLAGPDNGASLTLEKHLPPSSGIGGGSSDAAATLRVLSDLWRVPMPGMEQALTLGADVPVCLDPRPQRMSGIGEILNPSPPLPHLDIVLVNPGVSVSTPTVFKALAGAFGPAMEGLPQVETVFQLTDWLQKQRNDLQAPAVKLAPEIGEALAALEDCDDCLLARMSGSGATCFGLFPDATARERAARIIAGDHPDWWVAEG